jgi:hypothetical protein
MPIQMPNDRPADFCGGLLRHGSDIQSYRTQLFLNTPSDGTLSQGTNWIRSFWLGSHEWADVWAHDPHDHSAVVMIQGNDIGILFTSHTNDAVPGYNEGQRRLSASRFPTSCKMQLDPVHFKCTQSRVSENITCWRGICPRG